MLVQQLLKRKKIVQMVIKASNLAWQFAETHFSNLPDWVVKIQYGGRFVRTQTTNTVK